MYLTKKHIQQLGAKCVPQESELRTTSELKINTLHLVDAENLMQAAKNIADYCLCVTSITITVGVPSDIVAYGETNPNNHSAFIYIPVIFENACFFHSRGSFFAA